MTLWALLYCVFSSYPSGSAQGQIVATDPTYAARCLIAKQQLITGPAQGYWHPNPGRGLSDELIGVVVGWEIAPNVLDPDSLIVLPVQAPELVRYDLPAGNWRLLALWHVYSGGTIRGVFAEEDDQHALAPAAGDLLNPEAVACFLQLTHDQYYFVNEGETAIEGDLSLCHWCVRILESIGRFDPALAGSCAGWTPSYPSPIGTSCWGDPGS